MTSLEGKVALVTGVTSGIGEALVRRLCKAGMRVAGVGRNEARLHELARELGQSFEPFVCDLASPEARAELLAHLNARLERIDVLVNNAAEVVYEKPTKLPMDAWRRLLELNTLAAVELAQGLVARMGDGAQVVNTSSVTARHLPNARFSPYALTKVALEHFTEALRLELEPKGVKVTLVVPGLVDTPIYDKVEGFDASKERIRAQLPVWLSADDVAQTIEWVVSRPPHVVVTELVVMPKGQSR